MASADACFIRSTVRQEPAAVHKSSNQTHLGSGRLEGLSRERKGLGDAVCREGALFEVT